MSLRLRLMVGLTALALWLPAVALADEIEAPGPKVQRELQASGGPAEPARTIAPETGGGWADPPGRTAIHDWKRQNPWGYGTQYIFPTVREVTAADLPLWAKIPAYPAAGLFDFVQLPFGAIGGLWGD